MRTKLFALALLFGFIGVIHAGGRNGQGWNVSIATGSHFQIDGTGKYIFLKKITLSSGTELVLGDYAIGYSSAAGIPGGAGTLLISTSPAWISTYQITPALVFQTTTSVNSQGVANMNNVWQTG